MRLLPYLTIPPFFIPHSWGNGDEGHTSVTASCWTWTEYVFEFEEWNSLAAWLIKILGSSRFRGSWEQECLKRQNTENTVRSKAQRSGHHLPCSSLRIWFLVPTGRYGWLHLREVSRKLYLAVWEEWVVNNNKWGPVYVGFSGSCRDHDF